MIGVRSLRTKPAPDEPHALWEPPRKRRLPALVKGPIIVAVVLALLFAAVEASYGGFSHTYALSVNLPRAGQQIQLGSDVRMRGVHVGKVSSIELADRTVHLTLQIDPQYRIPASTQAVVALKTLLGEKYIDLRVPTFGPPYLAAGGTIKEVQVGPELQAVIADGVGVLDAIQPDQLATVVSNLAQGARGEGPNIAKALQGNAQLSGVFAQTLPSQLQILHDFDLIFGTLKTEGVDLNQLADAINQGVPVYSSTSAQAKMDAALKALVPLANNLADLLILNRKDWDRLIDSGDTVLQAIADRPGGLHSLVQGLYRYVLKLGGTPFPVPGGSGAAGFVNFIGGDTQAGGQAMICDALPLDVRGHVPMCRG